MSIVDTRPNEESSQPGYTGRVTGTYVGYNADRCVIIIQGQEYHATTRMIAHIADLFKHGQQIECTVKNGWIYSAEPPPAKQQELL